MCGFGIGFGDALCFFEGACAATVPFAARLDEAPARS
jgi:hypothetical protein